MTILDRAAGALRPPPSDVRPAAPTVAVLAALQAAGTSFVVVVVPVVAAWLASGADRAPWTGVLRLGAVVWLLGQHVPVAVPGGHVGLAPLGLLAVSVATLAAAGRRMARTLDPRTARPSARGARGGAAPGPLAPACFVAAYAGLGWLAAVLAGSASATPGPVPAAVTTAVLAAGCGGAGVAAHVAGGWRALPGALARRLPAEVAAAARPAAAALAVHLAGGAVLLAAVLAVRAEHVVGLHRALAPGLVGGAVLVVAQLAALPNLAVWAASFLAGPGFAVGAGTTVSPAAVSLGPLPAVPVLAALPAPGALPGSALLALAVPLAAGAVAGTLVVRARGAGSGRWPAVLDTVLAGVLAGTAFAVLAWLSAGAVGPGRLAVAGPTPWLAGAAFGAQVTAGALVLVGVRAALPVLRGRG